MKATFCLPYSRGEKLKAALWPILCVIIAGLIAIPIVTVFIHGFVPSGEIWQHLAKTVLSEYILNSLWLMAGVGAGVLIGGVGTAWLVTMCRFPLRRIFEWALLLPMAMPAYVVAYAYTGFLDFSGPVQSAIRALFGYESLADYWFPEIRSLGGAIVIMTLVLYPYVYMMARAAFLEQSVCVLEASRTLGCGPWRAFYKVGLPLARPAIAAGTALALMESLNDFGTVHYFAVDTFTTGIYRTWLGLGQPAVAAQLGAVLMTFVFALVLIERLSRGQAKFHHTTSRYRRLPRLTLMRLPAILAMFFCALPVILGFLLPIGILIDWAMFAKSSLTDGAFWARAINSITLASTASALAVIVSIALAYAQRLHPTPLVKVTVRAASLGYAIPGSVIAVGVLIPFGLLDSTLDHWMRTHWGISTGLILTGSIAALVFAYLVRFLAVALGSIETSLAKITPSMESASRSLGLSPLAGLKRVHLPLMKGSIVTAGLLVFVDVMKELPATLLMRPFNFDTLAIRTFELASDERLAEAALPALTIALAGLVTVILLSRAIAKARPGSGAAMNGS